MSVGLCVHLLKEGCRVLQLPQSPEYFEDVGDLLGAFGVLFAEEGGEGFGVGAVGGDLFLDEGDLGGEGFGPGEFFGGGGSGGWGGEGDFLLLVGGGGGGAVGGGGLVFGAEPADEAALFLGGAFVVEGDEAGEEGLLQGFGFRVAGVEA